MFCFSNFLRSWMNILTINKTESQSKCTNWKTDRGYRVTVSASWRCLPLCTSWGQTAWSAWRHGQHRNWLQACSSHVRRVGTIISFRSIFIIQYILKCPAHTLDIWIETLYIVRIVVNPIKHVQFFPRVKLREASVERCSTTLSSHHFPWSHHLDWNACCALQWASPLPPWKPHIQSIASPNFEVPPTCPAWQRRPCRWHWNPPLQTHVEHWPRDQSLGNGGRHHSPLCMSHTAHWQFCAAKCQARHWAPQSRTSHDCHSTPPEGWGEG